jgi:PAS domain-containing protein
MHRLSSAQRFQLLAEQASDSALIVADTEGLILDWSPGAVRLFGWTASQALGQPLAILFGDQEWAGEPGLRRLLHKDGAMVACDAGVTRMVGDDGAPLGFGVVARRAAGARERLRKTEEQLHLAAEAAQLGIWSWDVGHDIVTWENGRMHEIFGVPGPEHDINAARLMADYLHADDVDGFRQAARRTLEHGERFYFAGRFCRLPEREERWLELTGILQSRSGDDTSIA